jgi:hypothetical protein
MKDRCPGPSTRAEYTAEGVSELRSFGSPSRFGLFVSGIFLLALALRAVHVATIASLTPGTPECSTLLPRGSAAPPREPPRPGRWRLLHERRVPVRARRGLRDLRRACRRPWPYRRSSGGVSRPTRPRRAAADGSELTGLLAGALYALYGAPSSTTDCSSRRPSQRVPRRRALPALDPSVAGTPARRGRRRTPHGDRDPAPRQHRAARAGVDRGRVVWGGTRRRTLAIGIGLAAAALPGLTVLGNGLVHGQWAPVSRTPA